MNRWRKITQERTNTIDQHLLAEIRDHLVALPLAKELKHQDVETAKRLCAELDDLHERIAHQENVIRLLSRVAGIDPEALSEDELALLSETGARVSDSASQPVTAPDVQAATPTWYELAQRYATVFGVPDGGRYLNDWTNRVPAILEAHDALVARVEQLETALRRIRNDARAALSAGAADRQDGQA